MDSAVVPQGSERHTCRCHRSCSADCLLPIDLPDARKYPPKFPTELSIARFLRRLRVCERYSRLERLRRIKAGRPILNGSAAVQLYYVSYLTMFVLSATVAIAAIVR